MAAGWVDHIYGNYLLPEHWQFEVNILLASSLWLGGSQATSLQGFHPINVLIITIVLANRISMSVAAAMRFTRTACNNEFGQRGEGGWFGADKTP